MESPEHKSFSSSADYIHLEIALKSFWPTFIELIDEMEKFTPKPLSYWDIERERLLQNYRNMNPGRPDESLAIFVNDEIQIRSLERVQFADKFSDRFMTLYVVITTLSHALCEAVINATLAIGLAKSNSQELFSIIQKADIKEKWRVGPKSFFPSYRLDTSTAIFETLNHLTSRRNALLHNKIHVHDGNKKIIEGSKFELLTFEENIQWMRRFFSLPYDLAEHARANLNAYSKAILFNSTPIIRSEVHKRKI